MKILIDLFDHSGNAARPYKENGWIVLQVDIKHGIDILTWDYKAALRGIADPRNYFWKNVTVGIIAAVPCTDYALSGAKHFKEKDLDGRTEASQKLIEKTREIIMCVEDHFNLQFWYIENPMSRIHTLNPWMGKPALKFNPCDYAFYAPNADNDRYNKATWLWGSFKTPEKGYMQPIFKENPGWKKYGGKSERTKELRSITPLGFCYAFYNANN